MTKPIVTRAMAKKMGLDRYNPGSVCVHGHISERTTSGGECLECRQVRLKSRDRSNEYRERRQPEALAKQREYMGVWRDSHREKVRTYHRDYSRVQRSDPVKRANELAAIRRRRAASPILQQRCRDAAREWAKRNPDKRADTLSRYKAQKRLTTTEPVSRVEIFERDGWCCQICKRHLDRKVRVPNHRAPTIDHIVPLSKGGRHERKNLQTACYLCNVRKGNRAANDQLLLVG